MLRFVRAGLAAAFLALVLSPATQPRNSLSRVPSTRLQSSSKRRSRAMPVPLPSRRRPCVAISTPPSRRTISAPACWCSASWSPSLPTMRRAGCGCPALFCRSSRAMTGRKRCCSIVLRPLHTSHMDARGTAIWKRTACPSSAALSRTASSGAAPSTRCVHHLSCARPRTCVDSMRSCGPSMVSGCSTSPSTPTRSRRARVSSFQRICPVVVRISHLLSRLAVLIGRRFRRTTNNSASRVSNTENAIR